MRVAVPCLLVLLFVLGPRVERAHADTTLVYDATSVRAGTSCVTRERIASEVVRWLGTSTIPTGITIDVEGSGDDSNTVSFKVTRDRSVLARRTFSSAPAGCEELHSIVGLAVALALRASLVESSPADARSDPEHATSAARAARGQDGRRWQLGAAFVVGLGLAPRSTTGGELSLRRRVGRHFAVDSGVLALATRKAPFEHTEGAFSLRWFGVRIGACALFERRVRLRACVGMRGSALQVRGDGYPQNRRAVLPQFAASGGLGIGIPLSARWSLDLDGTCVVPLEGTHVQVRTSAGAVVDTKRLSYVAAQATLGPGYHF